MSSNPRDRLPFRQIARCFLKTKDGKILAQKTDASTGTFVTFPGGGVDDGENVMAAAERELLEETGAVLDGKLTHFVFVKWIWYKEMGDTPKRRERYAQFRGEEIHLFVGKVKSVGRATSTEGDAWKGVKTMSIKKAMEIVAAQNPHPNMAKLPVAQLCVLRHLQLTEL